MDMDIREIMLRILEVDLQKLNETVNKLFAELQAKYNNNTDNIEQCKEFINVLEICKTISLRADAIQEMGKAAELFETFLKDAGIKMEDSNEDDNIN